MMLTTTLDGLWVLQVLTGIEVLAPELGLRPHLPSIETKQMALAHPVAGELRAAGAIGEDGAVDETIVEWLTVLGRRDIALLLHAQTPATGNAPERVSLARFAQWWVILERSGIHVRLAGAGTATCEQSASLLINSQIERFCGRMPPAEMKPVTLSATELIAAARDTADMRTFLAASGLDADQASVLAVAADCESSAQASIVAIQSGLTSGPARSHVEPGAVTIIDTPRGRLVTEHVKRDGKVWMIASPGTRANIASAVLAMMRSLPALEQWHSYRKVV